MLYVDEDIIDDTQELAACDACAVVDVVVFGELSYQEGGSVVVACVWVELGETFELFAESVAETFIWYR